MPIRYDPLTRIHLASPIPLAPYQAEALRIYHHLGIHEYNDMMILIRMEFAMSPDYEAKIALALNAVGATGWTKDGVMMFKAYVPPGKDAGKPRGRVTMKKGGK
ncbi:hypothetical protein LTS18_006062 [Coniosporium uncinatum]|uniref:Uncharacterized protein n=1 Tax=Coniosporium uncinatum TaxID=93489 RepID=A0ACC3DXF1_9PEZI|nr:hypothetical protein LTS18_006062 [Coniosporium uncinatum]